MGLKDRIAASLHKSCGHVVVMVSRDDGSRVYLKEFGVSAASLFTDRVGFALVFHEEDAKALAEKFIGRPPADFPYIWSPLHLFETEAVASEPNAVYTRRVQCPQSTPGAETKQVQSGDKAETAHPAPVKKSAYTMPFKKRVMADVEAQAQALTA